ncbi:hypothetical protein GCM10010390_42880 [Streptomyces mordarskii]|uniref:Uncharacterized protein n=1 Tax=Streptomyces mordarskii TaxID=1226758 RepID=A0ABN1D8U2_9ACTN
MRATGFSQKTGTPARTAARTNSGVGVGRRGDHDAVHTGGEHGLRRGDRPGAEPLGGGGGGRGDRVGDREGVPRVERGQGLGVEGADPAQAHDADRHGELCPL